MRSIILYIAVSVDGYIATNKGDIEWLGGHNQDFEGDYGYEDFINTIDTVIMGSSTYEQVVNELSVGVWPYQSLKTYVLTHRTFESQEGVTFTQMPLMALIESLKQEDGKSIWICGGANVVNQLIALDLIDEYHLSIMPILLGDGIRLFQKHETLESLKLEKTDAVNGVINAVYKKQR